MDNIDYIYASNGSGEAPRLTITSARAPLATTLSVDSVTNIPDKFVATTGTLNVTTGIIDPATVRVFKGSKSGSDITIDEFAPGYVDDGNTVGQVVVIKPTTEWANIIGDSLANVKERLGGDTPVKFVVSATEPAPEAGVTIIWFEPL